MGSLEEKVVAVILVGGPTKGTRFRPVSFNTPKPLFPLAGQPMVHHPISVCKRILNLEQVFLIGFYEEPEFALYVSSISNELKVPVRCYFYLLVDVDVHLLVSAESANQFGELVADPVTKELLHYTEKPETFVSDLINCGVYVFTPEIFTAIQGVSTSRQDRANLCRVSSFEALQLATRSVPTDFVRLGEDILSPLAVKRQFYTYETMDFWEQIKTPGMALKCSELYLAQFRYTSPHLLANGDGSKSVTIIGDVYMHPSAKVHPTAKIGPNVSISANVRVGAGARLINCVVLDDVEIKATGDYNEKLGITILGEAVTVEDEVVVTHIIVLPNKTLYVSVQDEIML
ncbi:Nucleotidyl transferase domain [Dillenia turbinata]|uniref:Nucleotidyl transferase domain n=1 Tax=Dillenia turbinata TaxID=194707 RepID=A0AAN8UD19_9MAGN